MAEYVIGDGGHGRLLAALTGATCIGVGDDLPDDAEVYIGLGYPNRRRRVFEEHRPRVLSFAFLTIQLSTWPTACGVQIMPGAIIMPGAALGENVLVNTGAQIDHDCRIGAHCVISPGAILCGAVELGEECLVGAGAIIVQGVKLDAETFVPAGTLVVGPSDFRRPQRVVLPRGTGPTEALAETVAGWAMR